MEVTGDPELAATMRRLGVPAPVEKIVRVEWLMTPTGENGKPLSLPHRVVTLGCGHLAVTKNTRRAGCKTCHEMILNGEDYDAFRNR